MNAHFARSVGFAFMIVSVQVGAQAQLPAGSIDADASHAIVAMERAALDRWAKGDPSGYIEILAPDVTLFDATTERRINGIDAAIAHLEPIRGKVAIPRYELLDPRVQQIGDAAILTFNFVSYNASNEIVSRWNFTEVYRRTGGTWKIVQSHASYTLGRPPERR